jgi:hypothetical protein
MTKAFPTPDFRRLCSMIGLVNLTEMANGTCRGGVGIADIPHKYGTVTATYLTAFSPYIHIHNDYYAYCRRDE